MSVFIPQIRRRRVDWSISLRCSVYSALSVVINVDLAPNVDSAAISSDQDLFIRDGDTGTIEATSLVTRAELTTTTLLLPIQFSDGAL